MGVIKSKKLVDVIYECVHRGRPVSEADAPFAVKIEPHENGPLFVEMNFYIRAAQPDAVAAFAKTCGVPGGALGMPAYRGSGSHTFKGEKYRFLVMDRFGRDLQVRLLITIWQACN